MPLMLAPLGQEMRLAGLMPARAGAQWKARPSSNCRHMMDLQKNKLKSN